MNGINLTPLADALANVKAGINGQLVPNADSTPAKTFWISAYQVEGEGNDPLFARWSPTSDHIRRIREMRTVIVRHSVEEIILADGPDAWGADPEDQFSYEKTAGLCEARMHFTKRGFCFRDKPEHDVPIETRLITFEEFEQAYCEDQPANVVFDLGNARESLRDIIIESGDRLFPYHATCIQCGEATARNELDAFCSDACQEAGTADDN